MALVVLPRQFLVDSSGSPRVGAKAYFYQAGTSTPIKVYTTPDYSVEHTNPVASLASGLFPAIYVNPDENESYKIVITDSNGVSIYSEDNISTLGPPATPRFARTASEIAAGVTPADYSVPISDGEVLPERYGLSASASKDVNDAAMVKAFSVAAVTGATVKIAAGRFVLNDGWNVPQSVSIDTDDDTILDFSTSDAVLTNKAFIWSEGDGLVSLPSLAASITPFSKTVQFSSAPDVEAGDLLQVYDTADGSYSAFRDEYRAGEFLRVASVSGNNVTLTAFPHATYSTSTPTVGIEKVSNPTRASFRNFTIIGRGQNDYLLRIKYGRGNVVHNVKAMNNTLDAISCSLSYGVKFSNLHIDVLNQMGSDNVRGLSIHNSQACTVSDSYLLSARHGLNIGGSEVKGVVCREITTTGCTIKNNAGTGSNNAYNVHGNAEYCSLYASYVEGVGLAGNRNKVKGCDIVANANRGVHLSELSGLDHEIVNNTIIVNTYSDTSRGCFLDIGGAGDAFTSDTIGGTFVFKGNTCRYLTADTAIDGITIRNRGCTGPMHFVFKDNEFEGTPSATGHRDILFMDVVSGDPINSIIWSNNKRCNGWGLNVSDTLYLEISENNFTNGGHTGIRGGNNKLVRCLGNFVTGFQRDGVNLDSGSGLGSDEVCYYDDNTVIENNVGTAGIGDTVTLRRFNTVFARRNRSGGTQAGQSRPISFNTITTLYHGGNTYYGTGSPQYTGVTTTIPGAYTTSNVSTDRSYNADSTNDAELADVLGTLIADSQAAGNLL